MVLSFRTIMIAVAVLGLGMGAAFGAGVAYGRGDPKTVESGLSQQQLQSLLGVGGASAAGSAGAQGGTGVQGAGQSGGQAGGASAAALARNPTGRITAVEGQTLTLETRTGAQKINLTASTKINKLMPGAASDLTANSTIVASGTRRPDGSFDASEISQVPAELQVLLGGGTTGSAGGTAPGATTTPGTGAGPQSGNR